MKKQDGFGLVEGLLIILVLCVIGFAGYFVWNKTNENDSSTQQTGTSNGQEPVANNADDNSSNDEQSTNDGYIFVADWGVYVGLGEFSEKVEVQEVNDTPLANGSSAIIIVKQEFDHYNHDTSDLMACDATRFVVDRTTSSKDINGQDIPYKSGDYYYFIVENPNDECSEGANNAGESNASIVTPAELINAFETNGIKE